MGNSEIVDFVEEIKDEVAADVKDYLSLALSKKVSQTEKLPPPETVLYLEHEYPRYRLLHKGSISVISGKAKVGKTTTMALLISSAIKDGLRVLWIDTEQGAYYSSTTQFYLLQVAGLPFCENLEMYDFREFGAPDRLALTKALLEAGEYDLVIVDGVRDFVFDINSPEEATKTVQEVMSWSVNYDCHVSVIIHENKTGGELRGHLGTECENKAEIVLSLSQSSDDKPWIIVKCKMVRARPKFPDFYIARDENGLPYVDDDISPSAIKLNTEAKPKRMPLIGFGEYSPIFLNRLVNEVFRDTDEYSATEFKDKLDAVWGRCWKEHYQGIDNAGTRQDINPTLAKKLQGVLLDQKYVRQEPGSKPNSKVIRQNTNE